MKYPIVFFSEEKFNIVLGVKIRGLSRGMLCSDEKVYLLNKWIDLINSNKEKWYIFDSDGIMYKIKHVYKIKYKFDFINLLSLSHTYYVKFDFKQIQKLGFIEFKERVLSMLKKEARKWKLAGHDSQTDGYIIKKIIRANSPKEIIQILVK